MCGAAKRPSDHQTVPAHRDFAGGPSINVPSSWHLAVGLVRVTAVSSEKNATYDSYVLQGGIGGGGGGGGGAKKKTKGGKNTKGVANIIDGVSISEMSREQLEPFIVRIQLELEREREERQFFQLERDKIKTFWEITRQQLQEYRSGLRNKDKQLEKLEAGHESELKVYQQKIKYLLHGQHAQLSELKVENMLSLKGVEAELTTRESLLLNQNRTLTLQIIDHHRLHKNELRTLFLAKNAQISRMRYESERRRRAFEHKYQRYLQQSRNETRLKNSMASAKVEQAKNVLVKRMADTHRDICQRTHHFFTDIVAQNLALICALKRNLSTLNEQNVRMKNEMRDMSRRNTLLAEPLKIADRRIVQFQNELNVCRRDAQKYRVMKKQTKLLRQENEKHKIRHQSLANFHKQVNEEKEHAIEALMRTRLTADKGTAYRELSLQRAAVKLENTTQSVQNVLLRFYTATVAKTTTTKSVASGSAHSPRRHHHHHHHHQHASGASATNLEVECENENCRLISLMEELQSLYIRADTRYAYT